MPRFRRQFRALRIRLERRSRTSPIGRGCRDLWSPRSIGASSRASRSLRSCGPLRRSAQRSIFDSTGEAKRSIGSSTKTMRRSSRPPFDDSSAPAGRLRSRCPSPSWGERGSIDVLGFHRAAGALLVVEVKSVVPDSQATNHGLDRKARIAPELARERGWRVRHVSRLLVIGDSATSRRRLARLSATYDVALPARGGTVRAWLGDPNGPIAGILFVAFGDHGSTRRTLRGRERVRRPKRAQTTARAAVQPDADRLVWTPTDKTGVAVN